MYFDDNEIGAAVHETVGCFSNLRDVLADYVDSALPEHQDYIYAVRPLLKFIGARNAAITTLIQSGFLWDAEILMRPVIEAGLKVMFMSYTTPSERAVRIQEYWVELPEITDLKQSERARIAIERAEKQATKDLLGQVLLSHEEEASIRLRWPRTLRKSLEQKWSFSEIVRDVERYMESELDVAKARSLAHSYGISSHLIHADQTGVMLPGDRDSRPPLERDNMIKAHTARLLSDQLSYIALVALAVAFSTNQSRLPVFEVMKSFRDLFQKLATFGTAFQAEIATDETV